ncbi:hypothetical protein VNO77_40941 [Canavalia gladiata]|uniref:Uncharacterized protein n=1 Tax=Canavalia gladiata TaxID=3824 RepID=A0AAN9JYW8_CANGL
MRGKLSSPKTPLKSNSDKETLLGKFQAFSPASILFVCGSWDLSSNATHSQGFEAVKLFPHSLPLTGYHIINTFHFTSIIHNPYLYPPPFLYFSLFANKTLR